MNENNLLLNKAFCIEIAEGEKCHPDLGDGRRSYEDNNFMVLTHGAKNYFVPEADSNGNNRTMTLGKLMMYKEVFGDRLTTVGELPKESEA